MPTLLVKAKELSNSPLAEVWIMPSITAMSLNWTDADCAFMKSAVALGPDPGPGAALDPALAAALDPGPALVPDPVPDQGPRADPSLALGLAPSPDLGAVPNLRIVTGTRRPMEIGRDQSPDLGLEIDPTPSQSLVPDLDQSRETTKQERSPALGEEECLKRDQDLHSTLTRTEDFTLQLGSF